MKKPRVALVGMGALGTALAEALPRAGYNIDEVILHHSASRASRRRARGVAARVSRPEEALLKAQLVIFCVPDGQIAIAARSLAGRDWNGKSALHTSGALLSSELIRLRRQGAAVGSMHPMNTFVLGVKADFHAIPFAIEGDKRAVSAARALAGALGGNPFVIAPKNKVLYHALGSFSSPLLVALLAAAESVGKAAGIKDSRQLTANIVRKTLENYLAHGAGAAFSGPLRRGDVNTVRKHLRALKKLPAARAVYLALARSAAEELPAGKGIKELLRATSLR
jgi:predicted short-subunit dehydrogenase-like oxidoreductase (DUF2520 family)